MNEKELNLKVMSIGELFLSGEKCTYEIPVYQRNYAWGEDEIKALIQDTFDAFEECSEHPEEESKPYYVGTLVTYKRENQRYEVIDGQQRLTTIRLLLSALGMEGKIQNQLTYRAREKSNETIPVVSSPEKLSRLREADDGIVYGFQCVQKELGDIVSDKRDDYSDFFISRVKLIRYEVPKDIDLNQYFEVMNSRGEQLEMHEIEKALLMRHLGSSERIVFNRIWESCSRMGVYIQQNLDGKRRRSKDETVAQKLFGNVLTDFLPKSFEDILAAYSGNNSFGETGFKSIREMLAADTADPGIGLQKEKETDDSFQPLIDFPNFLLIVLKITRMSDPDFDPQEFTLDDKMLLYEFRKADIDPCKFAFNLLKARFLLDNYIVHHSKEDDTSSSNPWKLQVWYYNSSVGHGELKNLATGKVQDNLSMMLSMFEVSFTAKQRKNYLFYCLLYLMEYGGADLPAYEAFVRRLADAYFRKIYMDEDKLNERHAPKPRSFDQVMLNGRKLSGFLLEGQVCAQEGSAEDFDRIYGNGTKVSQGIPLYVFNYLDYRIWKYYADTVRGDDEKADSPARVAFFTSLGSPVFKLDVFRDFYFSRTRRSLEHYFPQANVREDGSTPTEAQINCFGNFAMIGSEANSAGSNWSPKTKIDTYLDSSGKINLVSVSSLKFMIMMQICRKRAEAGLPEQECWTFEQIRDHQIKMVNLLMCI